LNYFSKNVFSAGVFAAILELSFSKNTFLATKKSINKKESNLFVILNFKKLNMLSYISKKEGISRIKKLNS
jgi:hypothetical protein